VKRTKSAEYLMIASDTKAPFLKFRLAFLVVKYAKMDILSKMMVNNKKSISGTRRERTLIQTAKRARHEVTQPIEPTVTSSISSRVVYRKLLEDVNKIKPKVAAMQ